jgi:hypothetical protein
MYTLSDSGRSFQILVDSNILEVYQNSEFDVYFNSVIQYALDLMPDL